MLLSQLHTEGFQTRVAGTAREGMEKAKTDRPDAILLDVQLPDAEGWELLHQLKHDPCTRLIPVIILSVVDRKEKGFSLGAADYLLKPVPRETLLRSLQQHLPGDRGEHILVIEDNESDRAVITAALTTRGFCYQAVDSAQQGLDALIKNGERVRAVILDLMLPEMDGFEFLRRVKADQRTREIPIVVLTGKDLTLEEGDFLRAESQGLFLKGVSWRTEIIPQVEEMMTRTRRAA